ncbi:MULTISPECIES: LysR family transcriptional regulator [Micrococcaceae]|uniref:LysR family transcriptional regulator n=1 Tax=unclassified Kocuria TaxID=2649579 RepID=UPI001010AD00|nr:MULTISPECIES: LysR family transcriptional regulator [unclassified Kocuria]
MESLSIPLLRTFVMICRLGTFSAAAEALDISQPAVSLRVRQLENLASATLFDRHGNTVVLSTEGVSLLSYAERALQAIDSLNSYLEDKQPWTGLLRIGSSELFSMTGLPGVLQALESEHPTLKTNLTVRASTFLMKALERGELDAAFVSDPDPTADCVLLELATTGLEIISNGHIGLPDVVTPKDLAGYQTLLNPRPSAINTIVADWLSPEDGWSETNTCDSIPVTMRLVRDGIGAGVIPHCMTSTEDTPGIVRHSASPELRKLRVYLAHRRRLSEERVNFLASTALEVLAQASGFEVTGSSIS